MVMILLCPIHSDEIILEKGIFISTEMGKVIARELSQGNVKFDEKLVPVHLPYEGLLRLNFGDQDHYSATKKAWNKLKLPPQYCGEDLTGKRMIVFPMHGLGDQLYLAVALRALIKRYRGLSITVVTSKISSSEQWYPYIYGESGIVLDGPVVNMSLMGSHDYYVVAEHFAHTPEYRGAYPPVFYMKYLFHHDPALFNVLIPKIVGYDPSLSRVSPQLKELKEAFKRQNKPVVFISSVTTGRVRDLSIDTLVEFIELASPDYSLIVSTYKRPDLDKVLSELNLEDVVPTASLVASSKDLMDIIVISDLVITTDSGITHLSEALNKPCGSIFNVVSPDERTGPYRFSEALMVEFEMAGVCKTPCYFHALEEGEVCPGMEAANTKAGERKFFAYPPCMENLTGSHLIQLLDATAEKK